MDVMERTALPWVGVGVGVGVRTGRAADKNMMLQKKIALPCYISKKNSPSWHFPFGFCYPLTGTVTSLYKMLWFFYSVNQDMQDFAKQLFSE